MSNMLPRSRTMPPRLANVSVDQATNIKHCLQIDTQPNKVHTDTMTVTEASYSKCFDDDGRLKRTGTQWTAASHIITAVIGSGVLSLAWAIAQLGWIVGPFAMVIFALVILYVANLLSQCYRSGDSVAGPRNYTYMDAVKAILGGRRVIICGAIQYLNLVGMAIGYTVAASISMKAIKRSNCFHNSKRKDPCQMSANGYMVAFGIIEVIFSQIPDFDQVWWLSIVAAIMSFTYSTIGLGLGIGQVAVNGKIKGSLTGVRIGTLTQDGVTVTLTQKLFRSMQALGAIAFAYNFSMILIEIQDTLKSPPAEYKTMNKATSMSIATTTIFYILCGCMGYAAFGDLAPGNLLTGFGFYNPYWLVDIANLAIVIHLVGAYQVFCQPLFAFVEKWTAKRWPNMGFITEEYKIKLPFSRVYQLNLFRLIWRTVFVAMTTLVAMLLPFFDDVVGILGAFGFWPLTVYFPIEMYITHKKIGRWTSKWVGLQILSFVCLIVSIAAAIGSFAGVGLDLKTYKPFKTNV